MNIFDLTQGIWRQRKLLLTGFILLVLGIILLVFEINSDGIRPRVTPKYVASGRMAVVPAELESLTDVTGGGNFSDVAGLYAELLQSPEASLQIQQEQDVTFVEPMEASVTPRTSFIGVTVTSDTPEGAKRGVLGAFDWLEGRLAQPPNLADISREDFDPNRILDEDGKFLGQIRLSVDRQFVDPETTLVLTNARGDESAVPLGDVFGISVQTAFLMPGTPLTISVENVAGLLLSTATLPLPNLPEDPFTELPTLVLTLDTGAIVSDEIGGVRLDSARISASWDSTPTAGETRQLTLLLITEDPVAVLTGQRRTPIITLAAFGVGILVLLVLAITVDTWQQAYAEHGRRVEGRDSATDLSTPPNEEERQSVESDVDSSPMSEDIITRIRGREEHSPRADNREAKELEGQG